VPAGRGGPRAPGEPFRGVPTATYRVQLTPSFGFAEAARQVDYLHDLGVSHLYLSPVLQAAPGSTHGYDVVDHNRISAELGGEEGLRALVAELHARGMGAVADIVPNHMAVPTPESLNSALWSVLVQGPDSPFARWFDIDWEAQDRAMLMPVLGRRIGECLDAGEITLDRAGPRLRYYDHAFPVRPGTEDLDLPELLEAQWYRLAYWRVGDEELNYRRFFDIDTLAALRTEDEEVFGATHRLLLDLVAEGVLDGLRVDHPDGLADPRGYLRRLERATGGTWIVVEKVLETGEVLPADWLCAGTTGYDAVGMVGGLFVDPAGEAGLTGTHQRLTGSPADFHALAAEAKRQVLDGSLRAELGRLVEILTEICRGDVHLADHTERDLATALVKLIVAMPVYRAYCLPGQEPPPASVAVLEQASAAARAALPAERHAALGLIAELALGRLGADTDPARAEFCIRFQQTCAPVMAKGVEDTALYRWSRLSCLNEVGGDPTRFGVSPAEFHAFCARLQRDWPATMTALSTHDTKRSEDVRARLAVLSELPGEWDAAVTSWIGMAGATAGQPDGQPDGETAYLMWQTLLGAWPIEADRLTDYLRKAAREAKTHTCWTEPDEAYEKALLGFAERVCANEEVRAGVRAFAERAAGATRVNVLGQKLLQLTMPGIPDTYQGQELVAAALVDPDNRRPVDYQPRRRLLAKLPAGRTGAVVAPGGARLSAEGGARVGPDGGLDAEKLRVTAAALRLRRARPELFGADAGYRALAVSGPAAAHAVAFARAEAVVAVATRLSVSLDGDGGWRGTRLELPAGRWTDLLTGARYEGGPRPLAALLETMPVALLVRSELAGPEPTP
jgi:(1->4)-alpha-D-glucan 1-alpha-D-glucosylmutase